MASKKTIEKKKTKKMKDKNNEKESKKKSKKLSSDKSISFNFSIKIDEEGVNGNVSCTPPKDISEEDKETIEKLIKNSIERMGMFMSPHMHRIDRHKIDEKKLNDMSNIFEDMMRKRHTGLYRF